MIFWLLLTFLCASAIGMLLYKLHVPGGMLVGAILGAAALSIGTGRAVMPVAAKISAQVAAGAFIGCSVERSDLKGFRHLLRPALILVCSMVILNLIVGPLMYFLAGGALSPITALFCAVPGGISDIPIIAEDMGGDAPQIAVMQFVRMSIGVGVFPALTFRLTKGEPQDDSHAVRTKDIVHRPMLTLLRTLAIAVVCGLIFRYIGVPAGAMVGAMLGTLAAKLCGLETYLPMPVKRAAQLLSGAYIGCGIMISDILSLSHLILPTAVLIAGYTINCFVCGFLLHKLCHMTRREGMLAATPAGASDMALISADIGVNSPDVIVLQVIRLIVVVSLFPTLVRIVAPLLA